MEVTLASICENYIKENDYFGISSIFVNTDTLSMMNFFYNPKNKEIIWRFYHEIARERLFISDNLLGREYEDLFTNSDNFNNTRNKIRIKTMKLLCQCSLIYMLQDYRVKDFVKDQPSDLETIAAPNSFYRGQSNYDWRMTPSMIRNLPFSAQIDYNFLVYRYQTLGLSEKYYKIFKIAITERPALDYEMVAFMQHAVSYSPLLDFTKEFRIARSFSLANSNQFNIFENSDSSVFWIKSQNHTTILNKREDIDSFLTKGFSAIALDRKTIGFGEVINYQKVDSKGNVTLDSISFKTFYEIVQNLTPKFIIIDQATNDRMKYQQGVFLLFYDYVSVNGIIFYELCSGLDVYKCRIKKSEKRKLLERVYKETRYEDFEHLMNPYLYFNE